MTDKLVLNLQQLLDKEIVFMDTGLKLILVNQKKAHIIEEYFSLLQPLLDNIVELTSDITMFKPQNLQDSIVDTKKQRIERNFSQKLLD